MYLPWKGRTGAPSIPGGLELPPPRLGQTLKWHELEPVGGDDDATLYLTFTGDGAPPDGLVVGWLYIVAGESGELTRWPTLEEIYSAAARAPISGGIYGLPPFFPQADPGEALEGQEAALLQFRQTGAVQGSEAFHRFTLAAKPGGGLIHTPGGPNGS